MLRQCVFVSRQSLAMLGVFLSRHNILRLDRVWPNGEVLCCNRKFYVATWLARLGRFSVMTEYFYVATELARVGRISVAIEDCYVTTKLATTETLYRAR